MKGFCRENLRSVPTEGLKKIPNVDIPPSSVFRANGINNTSFLSCEPSGKVRYGAANGALFYSQVNWTLIDIWLANTTVRTKWQVGIRVKQYASEIVLMSSSDQLTLTTINGDMRCSIYTTSSGFQQSEDSSFPLSNIVPKQNDHLDSVERQDAPVTLESNIFLGTRNFDYSRGLFVGFFIAPAMLSLFGLSASVRVKEVAA